MIKVPVMDYVAQNPRMIESFKGLLNEQQFTMIEQNYKSQIQLKEVKEEEIKEEEEEEEEKNEDPNQSSLLEKHVVSKIKSSPAFKQIFIP